MIAKYLLRYCVFTSICIACISQTLLAQTKDSLDRSSNENMLQDVVVTGQYKPLKIDDAVQRVRVINAQKIAAMGAQNLRDVLTNEMNITIAQDGVLGSSISIQGISGQNVKILVDGVPVIGRQAGDIDISQLNIYNVERIEIIEGPMSVNFGTDALAGTINIITKSSIKTKLETGANIYTETIGKYNINASVALSKTKHTFIASGARNFFSGWDPNQKSNYMQFGPRLADSSRSLQWDTKEEYNANIQYSYKLKTINLRYKSDYFYDIITNRGKPYDYYKYKAFDDYYKTTRFNNTIFANGTIFKNAMINFLAAYNLYKRHKNTYERNLTTLDDVLSSPADQDTSTYSLFNSRATISHINPSSKLNYEIGYDINIENGRGQRILNKHQSIGDYALYGSAEYKVISNLIARIGLRYAYNTAFQSPLTPSLNIKYTLSNKLTIRGSYARGFRSPNVKELYFEFKDSNHDVIGNPDLKAEESDNFSIATTYNFDIAHSKNTIELATFYNSIDNMISLAQPDTSIIRFTYVNIDHYRTQGIQLNLTTEYKNLKVNIGSSLIGRFNRLSELQNTIATEYSYTPELRCNISYHIQKYNTTFSIFGKYIGKRPAYSLDASQNVILINIDPYTIADFSINKQMWQNRVAITLGCKNLFNTTNINRSGAAYSSGGGHSVSSSSLIISTGRSAFLGLGYNFSKN